MNGLSWQLEQIQWDLFATLTFKGRIPPPRVRKNMQFEFLRRLSKKTQTRLQRILWCWREEFGERFGRYHCHVLIGDLPPSQVNQQLPFRVKALWTQSGGGHSDVRLYSSSLHGVEYTLKGLTGIEPGSDYNGQSAKLYEIGKFDSAAAVVMSESLDKKLGALARRRHSTKDGARSRNAGG